MAKDVISAVRQDEANKKKESPGMRTRTWIKERNLYLVCAAYYALCITLYILTLKGNRLLGKELKPGIILGLFFPSLSILYFYRHYWRKGAAQLQSIITWILPALLVPQMLRPYRHPRTGLTSPLPRRTPTRWRSAALPRSLSPPRASRLGSVSPHCWGS